MFLSADCTQILPTMLKTEEIIIGLQISCLCLLEMTEQGSDDQLAKSEYTR